jgi:hypothetical protein
MRWSILELRKQIGGELRTCLMVHSDKHEGMYMRCPVHDDGNVGTIGHGSNAAILQVRLQAKPVVNQHTLLGTSSAAIPCLASESAFARARTTCSWLVLVP